MERNFNKQFKEDFMTMQTGEDWNKLKEKYDDISKFQWDEDMEQHFNKLLGKYSKDEDYRKVKK